MFRSIGRLVQRRSVARGLSNDAARPYPYVKNYAMAGSLLAFTMGVYYMSIRKLHVVRGLASCA